MEKLDTLVADHIEHRLLQPKRLEQILSGVLDRRQERAERRATHIAELRKRASEADAKLKRLYDAIENGVADLADPMLKDRIAELLTNAAVRIETGWLLQSPLFSREPSSPFDDCRAPQARTLLHADWAP
jgi:hypothetical protein